MPFITRLLDQRDDVFHVILLQQELPVDTILSDGVNVARFRVTKTKFVAAAGKDFSIAGRNLAQVLDA